MSDLHDPPPLPRRPTPPPAAARVEIELRVTAPTIAQAIRQLWFAAWRMDPEDPQPQTWRIGSRAGVIEGSLTVRKDGAS